MAHNLDSTGEGSILRRLAEEQGSSLEDLLTEAADPNLWVDSFLGDGPLNESAEGVVKYAANALGANDRGNRKKYYRKSREKGKGRVRSFVGAHQYANRERSKGMVRGVTKTIRKGADRIEKNARAKGKLNTADAAGGVSKAAKYIEKKYLAKEALDYLLQQAPIYLLEGDFDESEAEALDLFDEAYEELFGISLFEDEDLDEGKFDEAYEELFGISLFEDEDLDEGKFGDAIAAIRQNVKDSGVKGAMKQLFKRKHKFPSSTRDTGRDGKKKIKSHNSLKGPKSGPKTSRADNSMKGGGGSTIEKPEKNEGHVLGYIERPRPLGLIRQGYLPEGDGYHFNTPYVRGGSIPEPEDDPWDDGLNYHDSGPGTPVYDEYGDPVREGTEYLFEASPLGGLPVTQQDVNLAIKQRGLRARRPHNARRSAAARRASATLGAAGLSMRARKAAITRRKRRARGLYGPIPTKKESIEYRDDSLGEMEGPPVSRQDIGLQQRNRRRRRGHAKDPKRSAAARRGARSRSAADRSRSARRGAMTRSRRGRSRMYDRYEGDLETYQAAAAYRLQFYPDYLIETLNKALESRGLNESELDESDLWGAEDIDAIFDGIEETVENMRAEGVSQEIIDEEWDTVFEPLLEMAEIIESGEEDPEEDLAEAVDFAIDTLVPL